MSAGRVVPIPVDPASLLAGLQTEGAYTDAYACTVPRVVSLAQFVEAFYTTSLFKAERLVLAAFAAAPSTDAEVRALAAAERDTFAAWTVVARTGDELLLAAHRTRSWLSVVPDDGGTRLLFGSAVLPRQEERGHRTLGASYLLLGPHRLYSRALLASAAARIGAASRR
jgi:hypothetical protein